MVDDQHVCPWKLLWHSRHVTLPLMSVVTSMQRDTMARIDAMLLEAGMQLPGAAGPAGALYPPREDSDGEDPTPGPEL